MSSTTTPPSLSVRFSEWLHSIPLITRIILLICSSIYLSGFLIGTYTSQVCLMPAVITTGISQVYRLAVGAWFHGGILHILFNMMMFVPMASSLERSMGSFHFLHLILIFNTICGLVHFVGAEIAQYVFQYPQLMYQCTVGLSGILFGLLVINVFSSGSQSRSLFGFFQIPSQIYPWVLLFVIQLLMPGVSFMGHLAGVITGYMYVFGLLNWLVPSATTTSKIESYQPFVRLSNQSGYITNPRNSTPFGVRGFSSNSSTSPSSLLPFFRSPTQAFAGTGQTLRSAPPSSSGNSNSQNIQYMPVPTAPPTQGPQESSSTSNNKNFPGTGYRLSS